MKQHLKLRPAFVFLVYLPKPPVIRFHFNLCSLSNKCSVVAALLIDSASFGRVFMEVYISTLPGMRKELERKRQRRPLTQFFTPALRQPGVESFSRKILIRIQQTLLSAFYGATP